MKLYQKLISLASLLLLMLIGLIWLGKTINLTSDNMSIKSTNFSVNKNGDMTCSNANITGGSLNVASTVDVPKIRTYLASNTNTFVHITPVELRFEKESNANSVYINTTLSTPMFAMRNQGQQVFSMLADNSDPYFRMRYLGNIVFEANKNGIITPNLTQTSLQKNKKNFEELQNALDIIKNIDIYKYNLKDESDTKKKHIGFVIGDNFSYSEEVTNNENNGVDLYSFVSLCCKAIQEQQIEIEKLKEEMQLLKEGK